MTSAARLFATRCISQLLSRFFTFDHKEYALADYQAVRLGEVNERSLVWARVLRYLSPWIDNDSPVLEIGAGTGDIIGQIDAPTRFAVDSDDRARCLQLEGVEGLLANATSLPMIADGAIGTIIASNVLEHLELDDVYSCLEECSRMLRRGGHMVVVQPNFRLCAKKYFDDYTHRSIFTDVSMTDVMTVSGFDVVRKEARFLPLTMKSRLRHGHRLTSMYLRSPVRPLAGQMLVIGRRR